MLFIGGPFTVKFFSELANSFVGFFCRFKAAPEIVTFSIQFNARNIATAFLIETNTFVSRGVVFLWASIAMVLRWSSLSQILPTVIRFYFVAVINFFFGPLVGHPNPYDAMCKVVFTSDSDFNSPLVVQGTRNFPYRRPLGKRLFPAQFASLWIIIKDFSYNYRRKIVVPVFMRHPPSVSYPAVVINPHLELA